MTFHEALYRPAGEALLTLCLLLLTMQMALLFACFRIRTDRRLRASVCLFALLGVFVLYLSLLVICWDVNYPDGSRALPALLAAFCSLPVIVMLLYELLTAALLLAAFLSLRRWRRSHPTFGSVKVAMDLLPAGIAFGRADGTVVFSNLTMNSLTRALTGRSLSDTSALRNAAGLEPEGTAAVTLPDGSAVWQLTAEALDMDGGTFTQLTAGDITAEAGITRELEEKNEKLRELHRRLDIYNRQADRIIIAQELLSARIAVHSEVGNVLLESRHYLNDPASFDEERLLTALKNTNTYLLREYEEDDTARDPLREALETAEAIGVDVEIKGPIPSEEPYRAVLAAAVGECASNAVRHAEGDRLDAEIRMEEDRITYDLRSNGRPPEEEIRETGGLRSLRSLVENEDGQMRIEISPVFRLTIRLPR